MSSGLTPISVEIRSIKASSCFDKILASLFNVSWTISSWIVDDRIGLSSLSILGSNLFLSVLRWIARFGIFKMGFLDYHNFDVYFSPSLKTIFPAKIKSLSNQVCHNPPPYVDTWSCLVVLNFAFEIGANLRHGLSVWAPTILNPVLDGSNASPTLNATRVVLFLVKKYFDPFLSYQFYVSLNYYHPFWVN